MENVRGGYVKPWLHGIENLTIDHDGYVSWKGARVEHYTPGENNKERAEELAERCRQLEEIGEPVNKKTVVLTWGEKVKQAVSEGKER